jgi:hypothetical protein
VEVPLLRLRDKLLPQDRIAAGFFDTAHRNLSSPMNDADMSSLLQAAAERQLAVAALQAKYAASEGLTTEQLVLDMQELLSTERVVLDEIITLFIKIPHGEEGQGGSAPPPTA